MMNNPVRVAVVDDDEDTRLFFGDILQAAKNFNFVGGFSTAAEALGVLPKLRPDLAVVDIGLPDLSGIECTKRLASVIPHLKVIIVTGIHETDWVRDCLKAGARNYLLKPVMADQLLATLRFVIADANPGTAVPPGIHPGSAPGWSSGLRASLSAREKQVLEGLVEGLLYKEISEKLGISYSAVHKYQHNLFKKLHVNNRSEAIGIWLKAGGAGSPF